MPFPAPLFDSDPWPLVEIVPLTFTVPAATTRMSLPAIDPLTLMSPPACMSTRHMLLPAHDTDPPTASIQPLLTWILLWPVVHEMFPLTRSESEALIDMLQSAPVHMTYDI
jgi:hypothetical protein